MKCHFYHSQWVYVKLFSSLSIEIYTCILYILLYMYSVFALLQICCLCSLISRENVSVLRFASLVANSYEFSRTKWYDFKKEAWHLTPPLTPTVIGGWANRTELYELDRTNSYELATKWKSYELPWDCVGLCPAHNVQMFAFIQMMSSLVCFCFSLMKRIVSQRMLSTAKVMCMRNIFYMKRKINYSEL